MNTDPPLLTRPDRFRLTAFVIFVFLCMFAGAIGAIYVQVKYRGGEVDTGSGQWSQTALYLCGMFAGTAGGLLLTRLACGRFVSPQTQKRWLQALNESLENPYVRARGTTLVKLFIWAVVPDGDAL